MPQYPNRSGKKVQLTLPTENNPFMLVTSDALRGVQKMSEGVVAVTVTSPPYYRQKDYGIDEQIGWEPSLDKYLSRLGQLLKELMRVTRADGACFIVIGDSYAEKNMLLVPQRLAILASDVGWTVRNDLIWAKLDAPPDNVTDRWRFTHEHVLFLTKQPRGYVFAADAVRVPYAAKTLKRWGNGQVYGGHKAKEVASPQGQRFKRGRTFNLNPKGTMPRDVIQVGTARSPLDHFATYPIALVEPLIRATSTRGDLVLDPFTGTGTTGVAALKNGRRFLGFDLNEAYVAIAADRLREVTELRSRTEITESKNTPTNIF